VLTLPGTPVNVGFAPGSTGGTANTLLVGSPSEGVINILNSITWTTPPTGAGQDMVELFNALTAGLEVTEGNHANDIVVLGGARANATRISQGGGNNDVILSQAFDHGDVTNKSLLGSTTMSQGNGNGDEVVLNETFTLALGILQGNGAGDVVGLGLAAMFHNPVNVGTAGTSIVQGTGSGDVILIGSYQDTVGTSIRQFDVSGNARGDMVVQAFPIEFVGNDAILQSLSVTQGSAPGDLVALALLASPENDRILHVTGALSVTQNDVAGPTGDIIVIGSTAFDDLDGFVEVGSVQTTQGNATGDFLVVEFTSTTDTGFNLTQGNGNGDTAIFRHDETLASGAFFYTGGTGSGDYVQADEVIAATGTIRVNGPFSIFGTDFGFSGILISGFSSVIFA
jgi:hypothetical protein